MSAVEGPIARCSRMLGALRNRRDIVALWQAFWVLADQAVVSLANLATTVIIGRYCLQRELGLYDLGFLTIVLLQGVPRAIVWTPYTSKCPHKSAQGRAAFTGSVTLHLMLLAAANAAVLALLGGVFLAIDGGEDLGRLFLLLAPLSALFLLREHVRRIVLTWLALRDAVVMDAIVSAVQVGAVFWLAHTGRLSAFSGFIAIAAANAVAAAWLMAWRKQNQMQIRISAAVLDARDNWSFSSWLLPGAVLTLLCDASYRWFMPLGHGLNSAAVFVAAMSLIRVLNPLIVGLSNWSCPLAAHRYARDGAEGLYQWTLRTTLLLLAGAMLAVPLFAWWGGEAVRMLYGDGYRGAGPVVTALALGTLLYVVLLPVDAALLALQQGRFLFLAVVARVAVTYTLGLALTWRYGALGAGYGMMLSSAAVLLLDWMYFLKLVRQEQPELPLVAQPVPVEA